MRDNLFRRLLAIAATVAAVAVLTLSPAAAKGGNGVGNPHNTTTTTAAPTEADPTDPCLDITSGGGSYGHSTAHEVLADVTVGSSNCSGQTYVFTISSSNGDALGWTTNPDPTVTDPVPVAVPSLDGQSVTITFTADGAHSQYRLGGFTSAIYTASTVQLKVETFAQGSTTFADRSPDFGGTWTVGPNGIMCDGSTGCGFGMT